MEKSQRLLLLFFCIVLFFGSSSIETTAAAKEHRHNGQTKLFVFGDSYVDTGNFEANNGSWLPPYGMTFPGVPAGRFSDGRILTDYIADFLGIRSPIPYQQIRTKKGKEQLKFGVNLAHGGTGILSSISRGPILGKQVAQLRQLIRHRFYNQSDLNNSVAVVAASGNDYILATFQNATKLTRRIIKQLKIDMRRIHEELGIPKVGVLLMQPAGCLPQSVLGSGGNSTSKCNESYNGVVRKHNRLLREAVRDLNKETSNHNNYVVLDLFEAFTVALEEHKYHTGSRKYKNPLKPCVSVKKGENACSAGRNNRVGVVVEHRICKHPELSFFFDCNHPSQNGWHSIYLALHHSLYQLYHS
ncbi:GDSL esterase/lipase At5g03610 [Linum grandiflorum]